ncbi:hypothetical protein JTE90_022530 [Oedothorax gibbosus]|uniref:Uncharacterized protein n=1 Tax=Oedothorax gibbosus TaxID=931172 RepID=A0AAV6V147_9ARAC|nr:hypothetical protein JTE90_022530 [Oedothorax gibbosus]
MYPSWIYDLSNAFQETISKTLQGAFASAYLGLKKSGTNIRQFSMDEQNKCAKLAPVIVRIGVDSGSFKRQAVKEIDFSLRDFSCLVGYIEKMKFDLLDECVTR